MQTSLKVQFSLGRTSRSLAPKVQALETMRSIYELSAITVHNAKHRWHIYQNPIRTKKNSDKKIKSIE